MKKRISFTVLTFLLSIIIGGRYIKENGSHWLPGSGGTFTLQSVNGPVSLEQFKGKIVAIYFGYMSCPDICPTSLWNLTSAINLLSPERAERVHSIFISLDPDRDSLPAMDLFVKGFNKRFTGLTDTKEHLDRVARQYGVIYEKVKLENSSMAYVLNHTSVIYLLDQNGSLQYRVPHNTSPELIKEELTNLIDLVS